SWSVFGAGAGAGEFANGVLSAVRSRQPNIFVRTRYVIDEASADARAQAASRLSEFADRLTIQHSGEAEKPVDVGLVFSNELIDALPVHRVSLHEGKLRELCVGLHESNFVWVDCDLEPMVAD